MMQVEVSDQKLVNFQPKMEASACYLEVDDHILLIMKDRWIFIFREGLIRIGCVEKFYRETLRKIP